MIGADLEVLEAERNGEGELDDEEVEIKGERGADDDNDNGDLKGDDVPFGLEVEGLGSGRGAGDGGVNGEGGKREMLGKG
ncbi:hypothetical protein ACLOJK_035553 [Asimina triloba]